MSMDDRDSDSPPSPLDDNARSSPIDRRRRSPTRRMRERTSKDYAGMSTRELARMLLSEEKFNRALEQSVAAINSQLVSESERADAAEKRLLDVVVKMKALNEEKVLAQREAARGNEQLGLYRTQLQHAQEEIFRAQAVLEDVDAARVVAEESAAKARSATRKMKQERMVERAREEGRMEGYAEGVRSGREVGFEDGRYVGYDEGRERSARAMERAFEEAMHDESPVGLDSIHDLPEAAINHEPEPEPVRAPPPRSERQQRRESAPARRSPTPDNRPPPSPHHPTYQVPPDNYIPTMSTHDQRMRLPPAHQMQRMPDTPSNPPPPVPQEEEVRYIPPPPEPSASQRHARNDSITQSRPPRARRRSSPESQSTTISQFELVNDSPERDIPNPAAMPPTRETGQAYGGTGQVYGVMGHRNDSRLSVIPEVLSGATSPVVSTINRTPDVPQSMTFPPTLSANQNGGVYPSNSFQPAGSYRPPHSHSTSSSSEEAGRQSRASRRSGSARAANGGGGGGGEPARNSSSSSLSVPDITIIPPSRPGSNRSLNFRTPAQHPQLLTPEDAERPLPPVPEDTRGGTTYTNTQGPNPSTGMGGPLEGAPGIGTPIMMANGQLFIPTEVIPTPTTTSGHLPRNTVPFPTSSPATGLPPPSVYMMNNQGPGPNEPPVIPEGFSGVGGRPGARFSSSSSSTSETVDSGLSADTLTTPPPARAASQRASKKQRNPKTKTSTSAGFTAAGAPLPAATSSAGYGSIYGGAPAQRTRNTSSTAGATPKAGSRPLSYVTERSLGMGGFMR